MPDTNGVSGICFLFTKKVKIAASTRYLAAGDSSYNQSIQFRDDGENEVTAAIRPRT